ncbi:MAG: FG-GAP repeat protein [Cellvibrionales bacterium]|nr:FG-GAP repeat protein [Cellvibrionales bacterium]
MKKQFWAGLFSSLLPVCALAAAPGDMDLSFNHLGYVSTVPLKAGTGFNGNGLIQQADGKLVAVGNTYNAKGMKQFALLRYNLDGTLDTTFNGTGMVITKISDLAVPVDDAKAVIQQSNGRLVVVGVTASGVNNDCALVRYNKDGSLDETFGEQGIVTMGFGTKDDTCLSIIQQADDKLVVAGETAGAGNDKADFALARFNTDGSLDSSFGSGGKVTTDFNGTVNNGRSVIQLADGKLLMAGYSDYNFALTRYNTDGSLDTTFDADGKLFVDIASDRDYAISVLQQADDQLVLAGYTNVNPGNKTNFAVVRLNQDGSFDPSFNSTGKLVLSVDSNNNAVAKVIQQTDGKLVLAGSTITSSKHMALVRLNTDGSLDTGFGGDGKVTANIGTVSDEAVSVVQQADGKLTVAGTGNNGKFNYMMLARFHGEVDTDGDGVPDTEDAFPNDAAAAVDTDGDGDTDAWLPNNPSACTADAPVCDALFRDDDNDGDGVSNTVDNCPQVANPTQDDINGDGYGDACASDAPALHITRGIKAKVGAGAVVAFAGDFDEDGYGDYIVGYPTYDPVGKTDAGRAEIISGQTGGVLKFIEGNAAKDNMGFAVAGNADVDGDGHIDVVVGAPKADPNGLKDAGTVTVIYGPNDSKPRTVLSGTRAKALLGSAVALGDVNGLPDGDSSNPTADIIAGAPKDNDLVTDPLVPVIGAGSVTVFSGASGNAVLNTFYGFLPKSYAGTSVATGDVDDDGNTDIVYGAPNDDDDSDPDAIIKDTGSVAVYTIDGSQLMYEPGATAKAYLGKSVASADMDGDGAAEVLAGAPGDDVVDVLTGKAIRKDAGSVSLYSGGSGSILYYGSVAKAGLGNSVAFGDVDGDGLKDVIVGASKDNKPAKKPIKGAGSISIWSGDDFGLITKVYGSASKEALGTTVAAGEVNGDGYDDVMVGVTGADTPAVAPAKPVKDTGAVQVLSGAAL